MQALAGLEGQAEARASATARALLSISQKIERRPMLRSFARLPSEAIEETIATRISGATVASRTLM